MHRGVRAQCLCAGTRARALVEGMRTNRLHAAGEVEIRKRMNLSLSCDHRVVDGWDAASFMQTLKGYVENPLRLLSA